MVGAQKVYRKEDIVAMGNKVVNAGFGKGGSDTYSIWLWTRVVQDAIINGSEKPIKLKTVKKAK